MSASMEGHKYEYDCAELLKRKGFTRVEVTRGSGDQGVDIIAYKSGRKYGIQCKYYTSPVSNKAVQEVYAGATYYGCDIAVVMTNSTFTKSAKDLADKTNVLLWENNVLESKSSLVFKICKFINAFFIIVALLGILLMNDNAKIPELQKCELLFIICGGILGILGWNIFIVELLSMFSYAIAMIFLIIISFFLNSFNKYDLLIFFVPLLISLIRVWYLMKKKTVISKNDMSNTVDSQRIDISNLHSTFINESLDEYFAQAGKLIIETNKVSIGLLQRTFKIGFNRADRIMEQLKNAGVVNDELPGKVIMTLQEFENLFEDDMIKSCTDTASLSFNNDEIS